VTIAEKKTLFGIGVFRFASFTERMQIPRPVCPSRFDSVRWAAVSD